MSDFAKEILSNLNAYLPHVERPVIVQGPPNYDDGSPAATFYRKSRVYWANQPATVDGILGGYENVSDCDINASKVFLNELDIPDPEYALDCGAGVGRITKALLAPRFKKVDVIEQDYKFVRYMKENLPTHVNNVEFIYNMSLQDFAPRKKRYNLIWCQWVLEYLMDWDLCEFLMRAGDALAPGGYIVLKENAAPYKTIFNKNDHSYTRTLKKYLSFIAKADLQVVKKTKQKDYPSELFPLHMIACQPK